MTKQEFLEKYKSFRNKIEILAKGFTSPIRLTWRKDYTLTIRSQDKDELVRFDRLLYKNGIIAKMHVRGKYLFFDFQSHVENF